MAKFIKSELTLNPKVYQKLERKKQNEKVKGHLYKNWKLYATALGIIIITTGTGLGVSLGVPWHEIFSNLNHLKLNKTAITGKENMTAEDAFNAVLENNIKINDLKTNVEPSLFIAPSYTSIGSLTITAKADGKYNGSVKIKITTIKQINLKDLDLDPAITGKENMTQKTAFQAFLNANKNIANLENNVEASSFTQPTYITSGSLIINATPNGKYTGTITATITKLTQTNLKDLNLNTILTQSYTNQQDAFQAFLNLNQTTYPDLKNNTIAGTFTAPSYNSTGKLTVNAKTNSKYSGNIEVSIPKLAQTNLKDLNLNTSALTGKENMKAEDAFNEFLTNNNNIIDLKDNIETGTFTAPSYNLTGSLIIKAKADGKYSGSIEVTINKIRQTNLNILELSKTISGTENITQKTAFQAFLNLNQEKYPDLKNNTIAGTLVQPNYTTSGSLIINATTTGKYTGTITITITKLGQTNLKDLNLNTILTQSYTNQQDAFQAFLNLNQTTYPDLKNNTIAGTFTAPSYNSTGKLTVNAKTNSKYSGNIEVSIPKLTQINLNTLNIDAIKGIENMKEDDAFNAFLNNNKDKNLTDLKDNVNLTFKTPGYGKNNGSLTITAKTNSKYIGTITITINAIGQTNLNDLNLNKTISGTKEIMNDSTGQEAFKAFLIANESFSDLKNNVETGTFTVPKYTSKGKLIINAKTNSKYIGTITITINELIATDADIVDTINNSGFTFGADGTLNQSLNDFIDKVINGNNNTNTNKDPYWFIRGQLRDHLYKYDILKIAAANIEKYKFVKLTDINGTDLTDTILTSVGMQTIKFVYNYGTMKNQSVTFILNVKPK